MEFKINGKTRVLNINKWILHNTSCANIHNTFISFFKCRFYNIVTKIETCFSFVETR